MSQPLRMVCLVGATGTGKTAAALAIARASNGAVVNFDSRQVYAGLPIVTAQPTAEEQAVCPHALYGYLDVRVPVRAGEFSTEILNAAHAVAAQGKLPILVGGTGLYLKSLIHGLAPIPDIAPEIRAGILEECAQVGSPVLHARLVLIDPDYAAKIHPNDPQRTCRALEVYAGTGRTLTSWHRETVRSEEIEVVQIGLATDLDTLTPRLSRRIDAMLVQGALAEVRDTYASCPDRKAPGFSGIGCPELLGVLLDGMPLEEAVSLWVRNTRAYAKRQLTWFKKDADISWHQPDDLDGIVAAVCAFVGR